MDLHGLLLTRQIFNGTACKTTKEQTPHFFVMKRWKQTQLSFGKHELKAPVVHCKKEKYDVYIGRPSKWGNPFRIGIDGQRDEVLSRYQEWLWAKERMEYRNDARRELLGKILACWCAPLRCHGHILAACVQTPFEELDARTNY